jgi:hypothetical protein
MDVSQNQNKKQDTNQEEKNDKIMDEKLKDIEKKISKPIDDQNTINALPEYSIRTMEDDLKGKAETKIKSQISTTSPITKTVPPPTNLPTEPEKQEQRPIEQKPPITKPSTPFTPRSEPKPASTPILAPEKLPIQKSPEQKQNFGSIISSSDFIEKKPTPTHIKKSGPIEPKKKFKIPKPVLFIVPAIIIIGLGAFLYFQNQGDDQSQVQPGTENQPQIETEKLPASLIPVNETRKITISNDINIIDVLKQEEKIYQEAKTFKRVLLLSSLTDKEEQISLSDFFQKTGINVPPFVLSELKNEYTLVFCTENGKNQLGLITKISNSQNLREQMFFWETTMINDLKNLFLGKNNQPATSNFQDNNYKEIAIRYINFPEPDLTIDYAILDNFFVLTTSKESMYKIIDLLIQ